MSGRDPIEMMRELGAAERSAFESTIDVSEFLATLHQSRESRLRAWVRRRWRRLLAAIVAGLVAIGGGTVAWAVLHREQATVPTMIDCAVEPRLDSSRFVILSDGTDPVEQCTRRWPSDPELGPVQSPLAACKGPDGRAVVFPGTEDVCAALGLPLLDPTLSEQDQAIIALQEQLSTTLLERGCVAPDDVAALARQMVEEVGLEGWTITVEKPTPAEPCGRFGVDPVARVIHIQLLPDISGSTEGD